MAKFYTILMNCHGRTPPNSAVEHALNGEPDWLRLTMTQYLVRSDKSAAQIYDLVKPMLHTADTVMVVELNLSNRRGWVVKTVREWLAKQPT